MNPTINRKEYPELDLVLWDMHNTEIQEETAFNMYERRWRYIDKDRITVKEQALIDKLVIKYGKGVFFPS